MTFTDEAHIKKDRLRFIKNKLSSNLAILAVVFDALYFINIYESDVGTYYYSIMIGASVVYNLLFMLAGFLASQGIKSYKISHAYLLLALGAGQIIRIFILPMNAINTTVSLSGEEEIVMGGGQFTWVCAMLIASAACCIVAGVNGIIKTNTLVNYQAELEKSTK